jgi:hypothetical protein
MKKLISIAILSAALSAATAQAQARPQPQPQTETQTNSTRLPVAWSDPSRPGLVKVSLISGSIMVRTHTANNVIVESAVVARRGSGRTPDRNAEGLRLIGGRNSGSTIEESNNVITISSSNRSQSANFDIQVPVKTNLELSTINGDRIVVDGVDGEIEVTNVNGDVRLVNVSGSVIANAQNGNLNANVREIAPNKPMSFISFNGNVDVTLPSSTKANVKMRTDNGSTYTDFEIQMAPSTPPVQIRTNRGFIRIDQDRTINGTINGGGPTVELRTFNGHIYLRKGK